MKKNIYLVQMFCIVCITCTQRSNVEHHTECNVIDLYATVDKADVMDVFDNIEYIPLETTEKSLIGNIDKALLHKDKVYVLDKNKAGKVLVFDKNGNFVHQIGSKGNSGKEYIRPDDINIINDTLQVLDSFGRKILFFDLEGHHLKKFNFNIPVKQYAPLSNSEFCFFIGYSGSEENCQIIVLNGNGKVINKLFYYNDHLKNLMYGNKYPLTSFADTVFFNPLFSNTTYMIHKNGSSCRYNFQSKDSDNLAKLSEEIRGSSADINTLQSSLLSLDGNVDCYFESDHMIFFTYILSNKLTFAFISKTSSEKMIKQNGLSDYSGTLINDIPISLSKDNKFIFVLDQRLNWILENPNSEYYKLIAKNNGLSPIIAKRSLGDNPILAVASVRKGFYE